MLSTCGAETYQLIRSLVAPQKPTEKSLSDIIQSSAIVQQFRFHSRTQKEGETVAEFIADLRKLSEHCKFANTLDDMLRDRLDCGIRDARIQRRLLAEPDLTLKKAFDLAQASETADKNFRNSCTSSYLLNLFTRSHALGDSIILYSAIAAVGNTQRRTVSANIWFATTAIRKDILPGFAGTKRDRVVKQQVRRTGRDRTLIMSQPCPRVPEVLIPSQ